MTSLRFWLVAVPFFIGRCLSYSLLVLTASNVSRHLALETTEAQPYFGLYFVISQVLLLSIVFLLTRIDRRYLVAAKRLQWLRRPGNS